MLKAPDVPAVLIELGYLSNHGDADQMNTVQWRNNVAQAIAAAVDGYFFAGRGGRGRSRIPLSELAFHMP